nr:GNAT family N-acetyltransferase [uncultured Agathobaculum sp.]
MIRIEIRFVDAENADFLALVQQLDEYYFQVVGEVHRRYAKYNDPHLLDARMVAYVDGKAAGCGAWKKIDAETAEIKRIFVSLAFRRKGVASALIRALEQDAAAHGYARAILETARTTDDSAALYHKLGFREIPYYGSPAGAENCRCFEKTLSVEEGQA